MSGLANIFRPSSKSISYASLLTFFIFWRPTAASSQTIYLDQGWTEADRQSWYSTSQGSRLLPLSWMQALEQEGSAAKFLSEDNIRRFGFLPNKAADNGLPLGFAIDTGPSPDNSAEPWLGMTCAACHTGEFTYGNSRVRIDGAPTLADFQTFMESLLASMKETIGKPEKTARFVKTVLGNGASEQDRKKLLQEFKKQIDWYTKLEKKNASLIRYGHGRLDAQGHILNKISLSVGAKQQLNEFPSDAPASYPFIWNTPQQDKVQWNGLAPQNIVKPEYRGKEFDIGAMLRNATELIGVFGSVDIDKSQGDGGYASSLRAENMIDLENQVKRLRPPRWPDNILPAIDKTLVRKGEQLYKKHKCNVCHKILDPVTEPAGDITVKMVPLRALKTDIWLACNTYLHRSKSGHLEGKEGKGRPIGEVDETIHLLINMAVGVSFGAITERPSDVDNRLYVSGSKSAQPEGTLAYYTNQILAFFNLEKALKERREERCTTDSDELLQYKAGPLHGIWATAPYLHNGSVPTLYDLLLPPAKRPQAFTVGGIEFNPRKVGFRSGKDDGPFTFNVRNEKGAPILGNSNGGHEYGTALSEDERWALVEYLKSL